MALMPRIEKFEDLEAWKEARVLTCEIYRITALGRLSSDYGVKDQLQRAAVSVMSNIAEGFEGRTDPDKIRYLTIARGSCSEVRSLLYVCFDSKYIDENTFAEICSRCVVTGKLISGLIRALRAS